MDFTPNTDLQTSFLQVEKGQADYDLYSTPPNEFAGLARKYGTNRSRFWVHPAMIVQYVALNTSRAPFSDVRMRRAANFALARTTIMSQYGFKAGTPTDQVLPPALRGFRDAHIYPLTAPAVARAKALMGGRTANATLYTTTDQAATQVGAVIQSNLKQIGINVNVKPYSFGVLVSKAGVTTDPYNMVLIGWIADYADPYDFINILLEGDKITKANNVNLAQLDDPTFNRRMKQAALITGPKRYSTYGKLDVDISRVAAPWTSLYNGNIREFVSSRVGCYTFQPILGAMDLAGACIK
jgi:ABC-type oligopeptide transport system substrate-binding subunit